MDAGFTVVGIDMSQEGIRIARDAYPEGRFEVMPADSAMLARLEEAPFEAVVSTELIEHLFDPQEFLSGCSAALQPGGRLVISTPYHGYLKNLALALTGRWDGHLHPERVGGHIKFWSKRTLTVTLANAGFTQFEFRGAGRVPLLWKSMILSAIK